MDLSQAKMSSAAGPARIAMHAVEGFGKTTLACHLPSPLILGAEDGVPRDLGFEVATIHPRRWEDNFSVIDDLMSTRHKYRSLVFDTVDWIEPMIHRFVLDRDSERPTEMNSKGRKLLSIEDYGFGKGYLVAEEEFRKLISALQMLQHRTGMHVMMLMHSQVRTFKNPAGPDFDRYEPKCQSRIARVVVEWCESMLFGYFRVDSSKMGEDVQRNEKTARAKGVGSGERIVGARQSAMYDAKNRVGLPPEFELPEQLDDLISALLGENVAVHGRRATLREVTPGDNWADRQQDQYAEQKRSDAREQDERDRRDSRGDTALDLKRGQREEEPRMSAREEQEGPQSAPRDQRRDERRDPPPRDERREPPRDERREPAREERREPARDERREEPRHQDGVPASSSRREPGPNHLTQNEARSRRLKNAITAATEFDPNFGRRVTGWANQAGEDPNKIDSIIREVEKQTNRQITAA